MSNPLKHLLFLCGTVALAAMLPGMQNPAQAQGGGRGRGAAAPPPPTAKAAAPFDPTGYWVSVITNNWRVRMVPPPLSDYRDIPLTDAAKKIADAWNPAVDEAAHNECKYYGAASLMFQPTRLHITWQDDQTLRMDTDAGTQTRIFRFGKDKAAVGQRSWQGDSVASWEARRPPAGRGRNDSPGKYLKVTTTNMLAGYLRKNGIPYSENAVLTEYYDLFQDPDGTTMMIVTIAVDDPQFLNRKYVVIAHFKKESDASKWDPSPCSARW